jgi:hypothetical protein
MTVVRDANSTFRNLIPRAPDFRLRRGYGWICFCVFYEDGSIADTITVNDRLDKGYSSQNQELDFHQLQMTKEIFGWLKGHPGEKYIVDRRLSN